MSSINKALILGFLGRDPETRHMPNGDAVTNFSVATSETWKDKSGEKKERTEWHRISAFGKLAEICGKFLVKGSQCWIEGRIQTREWQDKDGNKKYTTEIIASEVKFLGGGKKEENRHEAPPTRGDYTPGGDDPDIPF